MKHMEWYGKKEMLLSCLERLNLDGKSDISESAIAMRYIIIYKYLEYRTVEETCAKLLFEHKIDLTKSRYYRLFNRVVTMIEKLK